jgi:hypothetical protein
MYTVIDEAEWRYIKAFLGSPQPQTSPHLSGSDFRNPAYGAIFDATVAAREEMPGVKFGPICQTVAKRTNLPGFDYETLAHMAYPGTSNPAYVAAYARMIADASFTRQLSEAARESINAATKGGETASDSLRVNEVIERHTARVLEGLATPWPTRPPTADQVSERTQMEERLVAALMVYPQQSREILSMVPAEHIQDFRCRSAYEYLTGDTTRVHMTSELELVMEIQCRQEGYGPIHTPDELKRAEQDNAFVYRLAHPPVNANTGIETATEFRAQPAPVAALGVGAEVGFELQTAPSIQPSPGLRP